MRCSMSKSSSKSKVQSPKSKVGGLKFGVRPFYCLLLTAYCLLTIGCRMDMQDQPKYRGYRGTDFFKDGASVRPKVAGTVARGLLREDKALYTGKKEGPAQQPSSDPNVIGEAKYPNDVTEFPFPINEEVLARGKERFQIFCSVCHGLTGNGDGMIVRRGFKQPPSYHIEDLRQAPVGHFFDVVTNGWGVMKGYSAQLTPADRWAIISYIRVLQAAQNMEEKKEGNANNAEGNRGEANRPPANQNTNQAGQQSGGHK